MFTLASTEDVAIASTMITFIFLIVWVIAHNWRRARVAAYNARLKQLMIERGMSAREIKEILDAGDNLETSHKHRYHAGNL